MHELQGQQQRPELLSPNSAHPPLPQPQTAPSASPIIPTGVHGLPANFVPQNFTSNRGSNGHAPVRPTMPPQNPSSSTASPGIYQGYTSHYVRPDSAASGPPVIPLQQMSRPPSKSGSGLPPGSIYAGVPPSSSSSSSARVHPPQFQHQIYGPSPPIAAGAVRSPGIYSNAPVLRPGSAAGSHTPRQIYAPALPGGGPPRQGPGPVWPGMASPGGGVPAPFLPHSPRTFTPVGPNMTPLQPFGQPLPGGGGDEDDDEGDDPMEAEMLRRNTEANARRRDSGEPLFIPPPSSSNSWGG